MSNLPLYYYERDEWSHMILLYDSAIKEVTTKLEILNNEFKLSEQYNPIEHISSRMKSPESIARKLRHREKEMTISNIMKYVNDVAGVRIICSFTSDIYRIASAIASQNDIEIVKIKDYIKNPKSNGYMSYHMIVKIPIFLSEQVVKTKVEIQIRTIAMDFWASLEHKIYYKFEGNAPQGIQAELKECADIVAFLDQKMLTLNDYVKDYAERATVETDVLLGDEDVIVESIQEGNYQTAGKSVNNNYADDNSKKKDKKKKKWKIGG